MTNVESFPRWSTVFFKVHTTYLPSSFIRHDSSRRNVQVEDTVFEVPRYRFTEHSEVFADMFHIPQAGEATSLEGKDEAHPITLDGYQAADFRALAKVLYPAYVESFILPVTASTHGTMASSGLRM